MAQLQYAQWPVGSTAIQYLAEKDILETAPAFETLIIATDKKTMRRQMGASIVMRRWLTLLLFVLLPLQSSWAVVAAYCTHESTLTQVNAPTHLGHHEHQHHTADVQHLSDKPDSKLSGEVDLDCMQCHGSGVAVLLPLLIHAALELASDIAPLSLAQRPAPVLPRPERPQWTVLA